MFLLYGVLQLSVEGHSVVNTFRTQGIPLGFVTVIIVKLMTVIIYKLSDIPYLLDSVTHSITKIVINSQVMLSSTNNNYSGTACFVFYCINLSMLVD